MHDYMLVLPYLFEADAAGCCQSLLVTLIPTICPLTEPTSLLEVSNLQEGLKVMAHLVKKPS